MSLQFVDGGHGCWPCHSWMVVGTYCRLLLVVVVVVRLLPVHALPFKKHSPTMDVQLTKKVHQSRASGLSTGRKVDSGGGWSIARWGVVFGERGGQARV